MSKILDEFQCTYMHGPLLSSGSWYMSSLEKCKILSVANADSSGILQKFRILMDLIYYLKKQMALPNVKEFIDVFSRS